MNLTLLFIKDKDSEESEVTETKTTDKMRKELLGDLVEQFFEETPNGLIQITLDGEISHIRN